MTAQPYTLTPETIARLQTAAEFVRTAQSELGHIRSWHIDLGWAAIVLEELIAEAQSCNPTN